MRHRHTDPAGKLLNRLWISQTAVIHQEGYGGTRPPTAETVVELFSGIDGKTRGFLRMERTARPVIGAFFLELDAVAHHLENLDSGKQILNERLRNHRNSAPTETSSASRSQRWKLTEKRIQAEDRPPPGLQMGNHPIRACFTSLETTPISARLASLPFSAPMTLPISLEPDAPLTASATSAAISASDICSGI